MLYLEGKKEREELKMEDKLYRIVSFPSFNGTRTADTLPSRKHPISGKLMLFTSYEKASNFIKEWFEGTYTMSTFPDDFNGKVTKRYIIDPLYKEKTNV